MYEMEYSFFTINNNDNRVEQWTEAWSHMFTSPYFGLLVLTLILSYSNNNWKKPIYRLMILHWIIRAIGEGFKSSGTLVYYNDKVHTYSSNKIGMIKKRDERYNTNEEILYSVNHWKYAQGCGASLNYIGQIIGDWYLYIRTKTVVDNKKQMIYPLIFIILFNFSKVFQIFHFFVLNKDLFSKDREGINLTELVEFKTFWWKINIVIFLFSFLYEVSLLCVLKKYVFTEFSKILENENSFLSRFKKISLYRLYITTSISVAALIVLAVFVIGTHKFNSNKDYINAYRGEPVGLDSLQNYAININYYMIYLDQILLKKYTNTKIVKTLNDAVTDNQLDVDSNTKNHTNINNQLEY